MQPIEKESIAVHVIALEVGTSSAAGTAIEVPNLTLRAKTHLITSFLNSSGKVCVFVVEKIPVIEAADCFINFATKKKTTASGEVKLRRIEIELVAIDFVDTLMKSA